jgi:hypothetical protein
VKQLWPISRYNLNIYLEEVREIMKNSHRLNDVSHDFTPQLNGLNDSINLTTLSETILSF